MNENKGDLFLPDPEPQCMRKKQSLCKNCVTKMARKIYRHFGLAVQLDSLSCDEEDTCDWERTANVIIKSLQKAVVRKINYGAEDKYKDIL